MPGSSPAFLGFVLPANKTGLPGQGVNGRLAPARLGSCLGGKPDGQPACGTASQVCTMMGARQLKLGLRVRDLRRSAQLYLRVGFREMPNSEQPNLRYLTFGHTWLILSDLDAHGYHAADRERAVRAGPLGVGFVLSIPTRELDEMYALWRREGLPITLEPEDVGWARIFYGLDPDGYEVMFEQFRS